MKTDKVTIKELYTKIIEIETEIRMMGGRNRVVQKYFTYLALLIILLEVVNMVYNYLLLNIWKF